MTVFVSNKEIAEISDALVRAYHQNDRLCCVDIDGIAVKALRLNVLYESIRENDADKIGFTADGIRPLTVMKNGKRQEILFPKNTIILDRVLLSPQEEKRRRFVLAHEIGHVLCNRANPEKSAASFHQAYDHSRQYTVQELRNRMTLDECQANSMAGSLLMPGFVLRNVMEQCGIQMGIPIYGEQVLLPEDKVPVFRMTEILKVSYTSLMIQLKKEGLLIQRTMEEYFERTARREAGDDGS